MTRQHRRVHFWLWVILGPVLIASFVAALLARPTPVAESRPEFVKTTSPR